jgi:hypothetical protein
VLRGYNLICLDATSLLPDNLLQAKEIFMIYTQGFCGTCSLDTNCDIDKYIYAASKTIHSRILVLLQMTSETIFHIGFENTQ